MAKKLAKAALLISLLACLILSACNHKILFSLYFRVDDEVYAVINTAGKEIISVPKDPVKDDMIFDGWYWDKNVWEKPFTANSLLDAPLTSNMSVYAKFKEKTHECEFPSEWKADENKHWHECSCGKKDGEEDHFWSEWSVKTPAMVDSKEIQERTCEICKKTERREVERYAKYTTEYYLQNLENDEYTLEDSSSNFGVIGSTVKAEIKKYPHFSAEKSEVSGVVADAGDTVIKVYYKRDVYTVTFDANGGTLKNGVEIQRIKYQGSAIAPEYTRYGYVFNGFDGYYENVEKDITVRAKWGDVQKQNYDMSGVKFQSKTIVFNGEAHSIFISGKLPDGVTVEYVNNGKTNAGTYTVTAKFTGDSVYYNPIPDKNATLVINKAEYDMSAVSFSDSEKTYSGEKFSIKVSGTLPAGVSVKYFNVDGSVFAGKTDKGEYPVTARFYSNSENHKTIPDMTAILSILPKKLDAPVIKEVKYDAVYWAKVENAESYIVRVNDDYTFGTRSTQCDLSKLKNESGESLEIIRDSNGNIKPVKIEIMARADGNFESSNYSVAHEEYYYIPESKDSQKDTLSTYGIGYGYNVIENDSLNFSATSQDSVFNLAKLLSVCEVTKTMPSGEDARNQGKSYSYTSVDEFMSKVSGAFEYGSNLESAFIGGVKTELSAKVKFKYNEYNYNSTFNYVASVSSFTYALKQFYSEEMLSKCLSVAFLKDIRREIGSNTRGMTDDELFEYLYKHYGTHAILGVNTGAEYVARCTVSTNKKEVATEFAMKFKTAASSGSAFNNVFKGEVSAGVSFDTEQGWSGEETVSDFSAYYKGSTGGLATGLKDVSSAVAKWSNNITSDNAVAIGFAKNGAIPLVSLISFYDTDLAVKYDKFIADKNEEAYNDIFGLYNKTVNIPVTTEEVDGKNILNIDLSAFQGNDNIKNAKYPGFVNGVFNVYPIMRGKKIDTIKVIGDFKNKKGIINGFSLKISDEFKSDVNIILENLGVATVNENGFIDLTDINNINVDIEKIGDVVIKEYPGYSFISNIEELNSIRNNLSGKYLLSRDIDFNGSNWTPISNFSGIFDGGCYTISNANIGNVASGLNVYAGLFGVATSSSVIKNIRVFQCSIIYSKWQMLSDAGFIVGNTEGRVENCRVESCKMDINVSAHDDKYAKVEFYCNGGGIAGVTRNAMIVQCYVNDLDIYSQSKVANNKIQAMARAGGIAAYSENSKYENCFVSNAKQIKAYANESNNGLNRAGNITAIAGGICGECKGGSGSYIKFCVTYNNRNVVSSATKFNSSGGGTTKEQHGYFFGATESTHPYDLICFDPKKLVNNWASGSNNNYGCQTIIYEELSYENLINHNSAFASQECWYDNNGKLDLRFEPYN